MLSQLMMLFGFFALVLVAVYWVNRAVGLFDQLIGDGQSALVFLEFSLLTLPNAVRLVLPVAAFAAAVYVVNRLMQESELVVMQATGFSAFRLARPVLYFGLCVMAMQLALTNVLVPASQRTLTARSAEISQNVTARFLNAGQFMHPTKGITLYIREITPAGELVNVDTRQTLQLASLPQSAQLDVQLGIQVLPGAYLSRDVDGINPGAGFIRVALVADADQTRAALTRLRAVLYDETGG